MKKLTILVVVFAASLCMARTEVGELAGVPFRIDVPENWNHSLVVYYHGYATQPHTYKEEDELQPALQEFTKRGYAVVQSGYSRVGWAVEQAVPETEALRKYFIQKHGEPKETFVTGHSMGGFLTAETIERFPDIYAAALPLCGAIEPATELMKGAFDFEVVFQYYFPGLLPPPNKVPGNYEVSDELLKQIGEQLQKSPQKAAVVRRFAKVKTDKDLAGGAAFAEYVLKDVQERSGGNPYSNRDTIYFGSPDDNRLNDGVKRYDATASLAYLKANYTLTGKLRRPVLAIHTTYDPTVAIEVPDHYAFMTKEAGSGDFFVLQYVEHDGHCSIAPEEVGKGFDELVVWTHGGVRPKGGHLIATAAKK